MQPLGVSPWSGCRIDAMLQNSISRTIQSYRSLYFEPHGLAMLAMGEAANHKKRPSICAGPFSFFSLQ